MWRNVFWQYYHLHRDCVQRLKVHAAFDMEKLQFDVAPLAKRFKETEEDRAASIQAAKEKLAAAFAE